MFGSRPGKNLSRRPPLKLTASKSTNGDGRSQSRVRRNPTSARQVRQLARELQQREDHAAQAAQAAKAAKAAKAAQTKPSTSNRDRPTPDEVLAEARTIFTEPATNIDPSFAAGVHAAQSAYAFDDAPWLSDEYVQARMLRYRELFDARLSHLVSRHGPDVTEMDLIARCFQHKQPEERIQKMIETDHSEPRLRRQPSAVSRFLSPHSLVYAEQKLLMHPTFADLAIAAHDEAMSRGKASNDYFGDLSVEIEVPLREVFPFRAELHVQAIRRVRAEGDTWRPVHVSFADVGEWTMYGRFLLVVDTDGVESWDPVTVYPRQLAAIRQAYGSHMAPKEKYVEYTMPYLQTELERVIQAGQRPHPDHVEIVTYDVARLARLAAARDAESQEVVELSSL